jgi:hypothetical protein
MEGFYTPGRASASGTTIARSNGWMNYAMVE